MPAPARAPLGAAEPGVRSAGPVLPPLTVTVGGSTLRVSRLGLCTHGRLHWSSSHAQQGLLGFAFDLGVRYFDTAAPYGSRLAGCEIGRFARDRRSKLVISTKFGIPASRHLSRAPGLLRTSRASAALARRALGASTPVRDYSARSAALCLEESLRALGTSYVDVLKLHEPQLSQLQDVDGLLRTLEALKAAGKVRHIGLSRSAVACAAIAQAHPGARGAPACGRTGPARGRSLGARCGGRLPGGRGGGARPGAFRCNAASQAGGAAGRHLAVNTPGRGCCGRRWNGSWAVLEEMHGAWRAGISDGR
jgi:hypothetical protein